MKRTVFRVTYVKGVGHWRLTEGNIMLAFYDTKREAVVTGREQAKSLRPSQLVIHLKNGRIQREHTYGQDPERSKG